MASSSRIWWWGSGLGLAASGLLALWRGLPAGLGCLAGLALGLASFWMLSGFAAAFASTGSGTRWGAVGLHILKFPLLLVALYLLLVVGHVPPVWFMVGYTIALITFLVGQAEANRGLVGPGNRAQVSPPPSESK